ncbi:MAG: chemotaxis protein CheW [Coleofasciculaceae cyanobacterium]
MDNELETEKFIVLKITDYLLALPVKEVVKVVNCSFQNDQGLRKMGLVQLGRHTIRVLDLSEKLSSDDRTQVATNQPFLVVSCTSKGELWGIPVEEPPNLVEIIPENVRTLPQSENQSVLLELVSNVAIYPHEASGRTIFLLDVERIAKALDDSSSSLMLSGR